MNIKTILITALFSLGLTGVLVAADANGKDQKITVTFVGAEEFSDIGDAFVPSEKGRAAYLEILQQHIEISAKKYVSEGQRLEVVITNIDMAGNFEPWQRPGGDDIRVVKDIYPPRIDLSFKLMNIDGDVIKEGVRELRDLNFMNNLNLFRDQLLSYEMALLDDWMRDDLAPAKTK